MNIYLAPMEGITSNIFRTSLHKHFGGVDKFFTPFITPSDKGVHREVESEVSLMQTLGLTNRNHI